MTPEEWVGTTAKRRRLAELGWDGTWVRQLLLEPQLKFQEEKKEGKMRKQMTIAGCPKQEKGAPALCQVSWQHFCVILISFSRSYLKELFTSLIDEETKAQSVFITHLLGARIITWSEWKEALKPRHIHLALVSSSSLRGLFHPRPVCISGLLLCNPRPESSSDYADSPAPLDKHGSGSDLGISGLLHNIVFSSPQFSTQTLV